MGNTQSGLLQQQLEGAPVKASQQLDTSIQGSTKSWATMVSDCRAAQLSLERRSAEQSSRSTCKQLSSALLSQQQLGCMDAAPELWACMQAPLPWTPAGAQ